MGELVRGRPSVGTRSGDYLLRSAWSGRHRHQAKFDQLLLQLVRAAGGSAPLLLDIDQFLDGHRLDDPGLADEMHMAHRPGLDSLETSDGPALAAAGDQGHVVERVDGRPGAAAAQQPCHQHGAVAQAVLFLPDGEPAANGACDPDMLLHDAPAIENSLHFVFH